MRCYSCRVVLCSVRSVGFSLSQAHFLAFNGVVLHCSIAMGGLYTINISQKYKSTRISLPTNTDTHNQLVSPICECLVAHTLYDG